MVRSDTSLFKPGSDVSTVHLCLDDENYSGFITESITRCIMLLHIKCKSSFV